MGTRHFRYGATRANNRPTLENAPHAIAVVKKDRSWDKQVTRGTAHRGLAQLRVQEERLVGFPETDPTAS